MIFFLKKNKNHFNMYGKKYIILFFYNQKEYFILLYKKITVNLYKTLIKYK